MSTAADVTAAAFMIMPASPAIRGIVLAFRVPQFAGAGYTYLN
jgi:hypothetical protein